MSIMQENEEKAPHHSRLRAGELNRRSLFFTLRRDIMDLKKSLTYYKDSLIVKHHKIKYSSKMPLWVIVELMSFSNMSKLYSSMYYSEKDAIANMVGVGRDTLENHLHCLSVLRNKCAHAARMYNTDFNQPAKFTVSFLRKHPEIKTTHYLHILLFC